MIELGYVNIVLDSCRFDSFARAEKEIFNDAECRKTWANHTVPVFTSSVCYGKVPGGRFGPGKPTLHFLKDLHDNGTSTYFYTDNPHLHPTVSPVRELFPYFTEYVCFDNPYNDLYKILHYAQLVFKHSDDDFVMWLWLGNTHQHYSYGSDTINWLDLRKRSKNLDDDTLRRLHARQVYVVEQTIRTIHRLIYDYFEYHDVCLWSDHGVCFGEGDRFGHGFGNEDALFDVPFWRNKK